MAILNNLLVKSSSRFLGTSYFQDVSIGGTASIASLSLPGNLSVGGTTTLKNSTITGTLTVSNSIVGHNGVELYHSTPFIDFHFGNSTADYTSRIIESSSGTLKIPKNLTIGELLTATTGAITTLNGTTVNAQNVNVTNNLRANHYDLQSVAQLGGSFYVSPTVKFPNSSTSLTVAKSGTTLTLTITDSSITSTTMAGIVWTANSRVKVSGTINGVVTGTMDGTITSINTSSHVLTLSVSGENSGNVVAGTYSASQFSDLSVMVYQRKDGSNDYRVGIWMNCYDMSNSSATIRIYGGTTALPNVMIGNLTNAGLGTVNNLTPTGWGLFAQNAFLHGKVVANGGLIGNWTIGTTGMYYNSNAPSSTSITMIPGGTTASTTSIGGSSGSKQWVFTVKNLFGVDTSGALYSSSGKIGGWNIGTSSLYNTTNSMTSTGVGLYLGTDGIRNYSSGTQYVNITSGKITALGVDVSGKITATSGAIGGFDITSTAIKTKDVAVTSNADNSISLSSADFTRTINSTSRAGLRFAIGDKFGVTGDGTIYANSANISGTLTAGANSKIGPWNVTTTSIYKGANTLGSTTSGAAYFGNLGLSVGNKFIVDANGVATLGLSSGYHATMDTDSFDVLNGNTTLATFGAETIIGNLSTRGVRISDDGFLFRANSNDAFTVGIDSRTGSTDETRNATTYDLTREVDGQTWYRIAQFASGESILRVSDGTPPWTLEPDEISIGVGNYLGYFTEDNYLWVAKDPTDDGTADWNGISYLVSGVIAQINNPYYCFGNAIDTGDIYPAGKYGLSHGRNCYPVGAYSISSGNACVATKAYSFARGMDSWAKGEFAIACGNLCESNEDYGLAIGYQCNAMNYNTIAIGYKRNAYADGSISLGGCEYLDETITFDAVANRVGGYWEFTATGLDSYIASTITSLDFGFIADVKKKSNLRYIRRIISTVQSSSGTFTVVFEMPVVLNNEWQENETVTFIINPSGSYGIGSMALGESIANGESTLALGDHTIALRKGALSIGAFNKISDAVFSIGNGDNDANRSDAFRVDTLGNVWAAGKVMATNTSHVGMIIMSTTLNTMAKVKAVYGGTTWIQHSGYFLYGASSGVTANHAAKDGGEASHTLTINEMPSHSHRVFSYYTQTAGQWDGLVYQSMYNEYRDRANGGANFIENTGGGAAHNNMPPYKNVHIWERTA